MRAPGLGAGAALDHLVVAPKRAVEEDQRRTLEPCRQRVRHAGAARHEEEAPVAGADLETDRVLAFAADHRLAALEVQGDLARYRERRDREPCHLDRLVQRDAMARDIIRVQGIEDRVGGQNVEDRRRGVEIEPMALAQAQEPGDMVDVTVGQHHRGDRAVPGRCLRVQCRRGKDLLAQVGRGVEQHPALVVGRNRERALGAPARRGILPPGTCSDRAGAVPLRIAAARRRAQDDDSHACPSPPAPQLSAPGLLRPGARRLVYSLAAAQPAAELVVI